MTINSRSKGKNGELELFKLLADELGFVVERNLQQTRDGGGDTISIPGWSVEVKRKEKLNVDSWWNQTLKQCPNGDQPILFYRQSRQKWRAVLKIDSINPRLLPYSDYYATLNIAAACIFIRESLN